MAKSPRPARVATSVLVEPGAHATPGDVAFLRVHARNVTTSTRDLTISVVGLEGGWLPAPVSVPGVVPDATVSVELPLLPPVGAAPGDYPFVVAVESVATPPAPDDRATTLADGSLRVDGVSGLLLSVEPAETTGVRSSRVQVVLANTGDRPARVELDAHGDAVERGFVRLDARSLEVGPHQSVRIGARAGVARARVFGARRRTAFHVTATGDRAPQRADGVFTARAVLPGSLLRATAVLGVAVLWVGMVLAALPWLSDQFSDSGRSVDEQSGPKTPTPDATDGAGGAGTDPGAGSGGAGGGGGDGGAGGGADGTGEDEGVRVSGVVTSSDPSSVTVQVVPAGALPASAEQSASSGGNTSGDSTSGESSSGDGTTTGSSSGSSGSSGDAVVRQAGYVRGDAARAERAVSDVVADAAPVGKISGLALPVERTDVASQRRTTTTGVDGSWAFAGLSPTGRYLLTFAKAGYETQRFWVTGAEAAAAPLELALTPGRGRLSGMVTGPSGPAGGVLLTISDGTTTITTRTATTGAVGRWAVDGLSTPSTYLVTASSDTLGAQSTLVTLPAAGSATRNLTLRAGVASLAGTVSGKDAHGGQGGLGGVRVTARAGDVERSATTVTGSRRGTFVLPDLPVPGRYTLTFEADGYATQTRRVDLTPSGLDELGVTLASIGGTVNGTTKDEKGRAVGAVGLTLTGTAGTFKTMSSTDAQGTYRFDGIPAGDYTLVGEAFGHQPDSAQVTVVGSQPASAHLVLHTLEGDGLEATSRIVGRATDAGTGARITCPHLLPGEKCEVTVSTEVRAPGEPTRTVTVTSTPDKPYELPGKGKPGLYPGLYRLTVSAPGYEPATVDVTVPMGQLVEAATVALYPSPSIVGSVGARIGVVPTETCIVAVPAPGTAPGSDPCRPVDGECETDEGACAFIGLNGSYEIDRLSAGGYTVHVIPPPSSDYVRPDPVTVTLTPGDVKRVDWVLDRLGVLIVSVYSTDGTGAIQPADGAVVTATDGTTSRTATAADGVARVTGLPRGTYTVTATAVSGQTGEATGVQVGLNQEVQTQVVLTRATADVTMRVVTLLGGSSETPVQNAKVTVSGVTGYRGVVPVQSTGVPSATTTSAGRFTVCTAASGCPTTSDVTPLALVENRMDVRVTADGYEPFAQNGIDTTTTAPITLTPIGRPFTGQVELVGSTTPATEYGRVTFTVTKAPPGVGQISISATTTGGLSWNDSQQPVGSGLIRPGTYEVTASLGGYLPDTQEIVVLPNQPAPPLELSLRRFGLLRIETRVEGTDLSVFDTVITVTRNGTADRRTALPGNEFVDFGEYAPGTYPVEVRAAGFARFTGTIVVEPGQDVDAPEILRLTRLGTIQGAVRAQITTMLVQEVGDALVSGRGPSNEVLTTTTAANGTYSLTGTVETAGLNQGDWALTASASGYRAPTGGGDTLTVPVTPGGVTVTDQDLWLDPEPASLTLFATNQGQPAAGLTVRLTYNDGSVPPPAAIPPTCAGPVTEAGPCQGTAGGTYVFRGLKPLTYTLTISGDGFSPLSMPVTIVAGRSQQMTVPVTAPNGSIQGLVQLQAADGSMTNVGGAEVTLDPADPDADPRTATTGTDGRYRFPTVPAGSYTLSVSRDGLSANRVVVLQPGDGLVVDLVLTVRTFSLTVTVNSTSDLTGALVDVSSGTTTRAAQPVVRSATNRFTTTFSQLPAGVWTVTLSGPAGHLGVWTQDVTITAADQTATFTVSETQVRLRATSAATSPPGTVAATLDPTDGDPRDVTLSVGGSDTVLWMPATGGTVTASVSGGWGVTVAPATIPSGVPFQLVLVTVEPVATTIAVTSPSGPSTVDLGDPVSVGVRVTAGGNPVTVGQARLERDDGGTWTTVATGTLATGGANAGTVTLSGSTAGWPGGATSLRVRYLGSGSFAASSNVAVPTVTIVLPTTVALTATATVLTATVSTTATGNPAGTMAFQVRITGTWTDIAGCTARPVSTTTGIATCTPSPALAAGSAVRARFVGSSSTWASSAWAEAQTPAAGP